MSMKVCSYTVQYQILRIVQSALHFTRPVQLNTISMTGKHPAKLQLMNQDCSCTNIHHCLYPVTHLHSCLNWSNDGWTDLPKVRHSSTWFRSLSRVSEADSKALSTVPLHIVGIFIYALFYFRCTSGPFAETFTWWIHSRFGWRVRRVIPVSTSHKIKLPCPQWVTTSGVTLCTWWLLPLCIINWFVNK